MSLWTRWFVKRGGSPSSRAMGPHCPFCGAVSVERSTTQTPYAVWDCECGAVGSGSLIYPDLDEVADGLLAILRVGGSVSQSSIPNGGSGLVAMQPYDIPKSLDQLQEGLGGHGFEMRESTWNDAEHAIHCIWARRNIA